VLFAVRFQTEQIPLKERIRQIDWVGATLFIASACSFLIGLTWGGIEFPWDSWHTLVPITIGVPGLVASFYWERSIASRPFLPVQLFKKRSSFMAYICIFLQGLMVRICPSPMI
jgi:hypothetical protein